MNKKLLCKECGSEYEINTKEFSDCINCRKKGKQSFLEVSYDYENITDEEIVKFEPSEPTTFWDFDFILPVEKQHGKYIGEGNTPLIKNPTYIGAGYNVYLKLEYLNPTMAHKDRFQTIAAAMAKKLGYKGVTTVSTGNHGASCVAYGSANNMKSVVFCPPEVSDALRRLIKFYGGELVIADWDERIFLMRDLLDQGFFPATLMDSDVEGTSNPYCAEGYKTMAYEMYKQLGQAPDHVLIPCARGDTTYGVYKGFWELKKLGITSKIPKIYPCQPKGANSLEESFHRGFEKVVTINNPYSIATSTMEPTTGNHAYSAMKESGGLPLTVTDEEIINAMFELGRNGICAEPSSAMPLACVNELMLRSGIGADEAVVAVITSTGIKWPNVITDLLERKDKKKDGK